MWTREAAFIVYQNNWHWHYYIWACVFVNCCRSWHILVHARVHSLTLRCVKSERWCWQTAEHLVSKWSPWPPSSATVSAWNKLFLIWTGIVCSQSSEVPLAPRSRDKNKYGNQGRCDTWPLPGKMAAGQRRYSTSKSNLLSCLKYACWQLRWHFRVFFFLTGEQSSQRSLPLIAEIFFF